MTRVRDIDHLRFMPLQNGHTLEHLTKQGPNPRMLAFLAGYDKNGKWHPDKTKQALDQLHAEREASRPSSKRKRNSANTQNKRGCPSQTLDKNKTEKRKVPSSDTTAPPKNSGKRKAPSSDPNLPPGSFTVHGLDGIFKSFPTPEDGSCLFHAFKACTQCTDPVPFMRANLVAQIESIQDPQLRVHHMIQFFPNAQLHTPDFATRKFNSYWRQYKTAMLGNAWCGIFELCQLATMYNKSTVLWQRSSPSTVSFIERCILPSAQVSALLHNLQDTVRK